MKRPLAVAAVAVLYIVSGISGIIYHAPELKEIANDKAIVLVLLLRMLAIVAGIFIWRGANWARWVAVAWIAYHLVISFGHESAQIVMHAVVMAVVIIALFIPKSNRFFRQHQ